MVVITTTWWTSVVLLGLALADAGFDVTVLCPRGHAAWRARRLHCVALGGLDGLPALSAAIDAANPVLLVPADDRSVLYLQQLHATAEPPLAALIERSIGPAAMFATTASRTPFLAVAQDCGLATPRNQEVRTSDDLDLWMATIKAPWILKVDNSWGGEGVRMARTVREARDAFVALSRGTPSWLVQKRAIINGDWFGVADRRVRRTPAVSVQAFVAGGAGHCVMFCREGDILGSTIFEVDRNCGERGPATRVHRVERAPLLEAAARLVRRLGWSGFGCLDFIVDAASGEPMIIEFNPRITASCRIRTSPNVDPIAAAAASFGCQVEEQPPIERSTFALFPLAWQDDPFDPVLQSCQDDVPWHEPAVVAEAFRPLWPERNVLSRATLAMRRMGRHLRNGGPRPDAIGRPLAWWLANGLLRPPEAGGTEASRTEAYRAREANRDISRLNASAPKVSPFTPSPDEGGNRGRSAAPA